MSGTEQEQSDERLINASLAGHDGAFALLVSRYKRKVFGLASRIARDRDELEDLCQEVFIKVYDNLGKFRGEAPFEHWLTKIAVRICHDALRSRRHERFRVTDSRLSELHDHGAEARSHASEARQLLAWAIGQLKPDEQLVITLLELEEKSIRETASLTGWSESNIKVRAFRARQALKLILEVEHGRQL
ncbi:MAG: RNA polymerase sigma factor [Geobacter sp.]|nr:RNA polymerase sigma factor [Geobacter sp.]